MPESLATNQARIFVSVASYRDPETPPTLADLYAKASFPERIFCGVLWQLVPGEDDDCRVLAKHVPPSQIRSQQVHPKDSLGACWARHRILTELRQDEAFVLQIDSHMRFVDGWDEKLLAMWVDCQSDRALLSTYPVAYVPPDELGAKAIPVLHPAQFNHRGILTFKARSDNYAFRRERPTPNAFVCAGFLFGPKAAFDDVPYDPYLYFHGEEISLSARFWTHGWNPFTPNDVLIYHYYGRSEQRPRHWSDNPNWSNLDARSLSRLRHLFGIEISTDISVIGAIENYGLGAARTLKEYEHYADVNLSGQEIGPASASGRYPPHPEPSALATARIFQQIYETNVWASVESRSGAGSTRAATLHVAQQLKEFFATNSVSTVLDAGCGDVNWIYEVSGGLAQYFGVDLVAELIQQNIRLHHHRPGHFFGVADICRDPLPKVDTILCRHVLTHLPNDQINSAIKNFAQTGARWLITTSYNDSDNPETKPGFWRRINLTREPFSLPEPMLKIADGNGCWLGVWRLNQGG